MSHSDNKKEIPYEITAGGSLGLLALGAVGLKAWRAKRAELEQQNQNVSNPKTEES